MSSGGDGRRYNATGRIRSFYSFEVSWYVVNYFEYQCPRVALSDVLSGCIHMGGGMSKSLVSNDEYNAK